MQVSARTPSRTSIRLVTCCSYNAALFVNYAAAMADTQQVGANTVITYDANDTVTLTGVTASHLTASNFKFT